MTSMQRNINELLQRKMSRKEFLATVGLGLVSIFGFSNLINLLDAGKNTSAKKQNNGYGSSPYGGNKSSQS
jgi:hypothetical protein